MALQHNNPINDMVDSFANALKAKLNKTAERYPDHAWMTPDWYDECVLEMHKHIQKGDPIDVAAYCAFMFYHKWSTATKPMKSDESFKRLVELKDTYFTVYVNRHCTPISKPDGTMLYIVNETGQPFNNMDALYAHFEKELWNQKENVEWNKPLTEKIVL